MVVRARSDGGRRLLIPFLAVGVVLGCAHSRSGYEESTNATTIGPVPDLSDQQQDRRVAVFTFSSKRSGPLGGRPDGAAIADAFADALRRSGAYREVGRIQTLLDPDTDLGRPIPCQGYQAALLGNITKHEAYSDGLPFIPSYGHAVLAANVVLADCETGRTLSVIPDLYARFEASWTSSGDLRSGAVQLSAVELVERITAGSTPARSVGGDTAGADLAGASGSAGVMPGAGRRTGRTRFGSGRFYDRRVAAVVGIDAYRHWPPLEGARRDAERVASLLREMGFDEVIELYDGQATRQRILDLLGQELPMHVGENDLAVIFFAGHGQTETLARDHKQGYIIPADADVTRVFSSAISMPSLRSLSNRLAAKHVFFAMDSCYSGLGLQRGLTVVDKVPGYLDKLTSRRAVQMITAGAEGETAIEIGGKGLFTSKLIEGLRGEADHDGDGMVTASELGTYVVPEVSALSDQRQTPRFGTLEGTGEVVFAVPPRVR